MLPEHATGDFLGRESRVSPWLNPRLFGEHNASSVSDFRIDTSILLEPTGGVIPEPLTMAGVLLGIAGVARYVRQRRAA